MIQLLLSIHPVSSLFYQHFSFCTCICEPLDTISLSLSNFFWFFWFFLFFWLDASLFVSFILFMFPYLCSSSCSGSSFLFTLFPFPSIQLEITFIPLCFSPTNCLFLSLSHYESPFIFSRFHPISSQHARKVTSTPTHTLTHTHERTTTRTINHTTLGHTCTSTCTRTHQRPDSNLRLIFPVPSCCFFMVRNFNSVFLSSEHQMNS